MTRKKSPLLWGAAPLIFCLCGCLNGRTQLPTIWSPRPHALQPGVGPWARAESRRDVRHDPFPSTEAGPKLFTRPREAVAPRSDTRRFQEERMFQRGTTNTPGGYPPGEAYRQSYGDAVR